MVGVGKGGGGGGCTGSVVGEKRKISKQTKTEVNFRGVRLCTSLRDQQTTMQPRQPQGGAKKNN